MEATRLEHERLKVEKLKLQAARPHPVREFFGNAFGFVGNVFAPVFAWWTLFKSIPLLIWGTFSLVAAIVLLQFLKWLSRK